jgi:hypothetical protein
MCQCNNQNCGCVPEDYTSQIVYDGIKFTCPELASIVPNCTKLDILLQIFGEQICSLLGTQSPVNTLVLPIGAWDMDNNAILVVPHTLSATEFATISNVQVLVDNDAQDTKRPLNTNEGSAFNGTFNIDANNVNLEVFAGGIFDAATYSSVANNRGYIVINYTKD